MRPPAAEIGEAGRILMEKVTVYITEDGKRFSGPNALEKAKEHDRNLLFNGANCQTEFERIKTRCEYKTKGGSCSYIRTRISGGGYTFCNEPNCPKIHGMPPGY